MTQKELDELARVKCVTSYQGSLEQFAVDNFKAGYEASATAFTEQQDIPMEKDGLSHFLDINLKQSKEIQGSNRMFMAGWIAALMHVKVNFADRQSPKEEK